jgi:predicted RNase H-like nuclease (RuvC/YqgF family)
MSSEIQSMTSQMKHKEQEWKQIHSSVSQEMNRLQQEYMESQRTVKKLTADTEKLYSLRTVSVFANISLLN